MPPMMATVPTHQGSLKKRKALEVEIAPLYEQDLGLEGIKQRRTTSYSMSTIQRSMKLNREEIEKMQERKQRFGNGISIRKDEPDPLLKPLSASRGSNVVEKANIKKHERLVGTSTKLEKSYLRLTTFPRKEDVRPLDVLLKSLAHIKSKYVQEEDFEWVNDQLKSVRQDLVCQGIRNKFVLDVYETHARILLEHGDLNEFNQCQTMIRSLTERTDNAVAQDPSGLDPSLCHEISDIDDEHKPLQQSEDHKMEFLSYALLYALVRNSNVELKREMTRIQHFVSRSKHSRHESCCDHSLQVLKAVEECNYRTFFRLYASAPHMSAYLMDFLVKRVRDQAYERIIASYRPSISVEHIRESLYFDDLEETRRFLRQRRAVFIHEKGEPPFWIDCKESKSRCKSR